MKWSEIGYALLCVVTPMAWGLIVVRMSNLIEQKVRASKKPDAAPEAPQIEYHI